VSATVFFFLQVVEGVCSISLLIIKDTSEQHESISLGQDYSWLYAVCPGWFWKVENWLHPTLLTKQYSILSNANLDSQDSALCSSCNSHNPDAASNCQSYAELVEKLKWHAPWSFAGRLPMLATEEGG
jgi:iron only hydrogenase large subunit-like protein